MLKRISDWFYYRTVANWGLPWHLIISYAGTDVIDLFLASYLAFGIAVVVGILYEIYQSQTERGRHSRFYKDAVEDFIADLIGAFLAILL